MMQKYFCPPCTRNNGHAMKLNESDVCIPTTSQVPLRNIRRVSIANHFANLSVPDCRMIGGSVEAYDGAGFKMSSSQRGERLLSQYEGNASEQLVSSFKNM